MNETGRKEIGKQLRAVRERLNMTLEELSQDTGISRSYISEFERGVKLPTSKYLRYLHDRHNEVLSDFGLALNARSESLQIQFIQIPKSHADLSYPLYCLHFLNCHSFCIAM